MSKTSHDESVPIAWLRPTIVFVATLLLTFFLWGLQERSLQGRLYLETQVTAEQTGRRLSDWLDDRMSLSAFLAEKWQLEYEADPGRFDRDATWMVERFPGFQAINWIDPGWVIRRVIPLQGNLSALNVNLGTHPSPDVRDALDLAFRERTLVRTPAVIDLLQGGKGFATYRPIYDENGNALGCINTVFRVNELIDACLGQLHVKQRFNFAIRESGGAVVYPMGVAPDYLSGPQSAVEVVNVAGKPWMFYLAPSPDYMRQQRYSVHHLILPAGLLVALLLAGFERRLMARKRALDSSQAQYRALFEQAPVAYFSVCPDASIERANWVAESMTGISVEELVGSSFYELLPERDDARTRARLLFEAVHRGEPIRSLELAMCRANGDRFRAILYVDGVYGGGGVFSRYRIAAVDVTERHEAEKARARLSAAVDQSEDGVVITDRAGEILYLNPAAGAAEEPGRIPSLAGFLEGKGASPDIIQEVYGAIAAQSSWRGSCPLGRKDGKRAQTVSTLSPVRDDGGDVINFVFVQRDISHEVELQSQLQQAHKLEAIGRLAGGIAHDFNNILQSLLGYATLARRNVTSQEEVILCLDEIERASHRAANLVAHILTFGRQSVLDRKSMLLRPVVEEVAALVRGSMPEGIRFDVLFGDIEHRVLADSTQIHQVLMNLASNALHALREGGTLTFRYEAVEVSHVEVARWPALKPRMHMRIQVTDDGIGMESGTLARIFEPYFSTRQIGTGTGLGLATVHGIVENHGGVIFAESAPGQGACFTILLPAELAGEGVSPSPSEDPRSSVTEENVEQNEDRIRLLYVDDETQIVDSMRRILERLGFEVTGYTSGRAALDALEANPMDFNVLVTDLTMPELNGVELAEAAARIRPDMPVILCSGYGESYERDMGEKSRAIHSFLRKPISARDLAAEIKRLASGNGRSK